MERRAELVHAPVPRGLIQAWRSHIGCRRRGHLAVIPWTGHVWLMVVLVRMRGSMLGMLLSMWGPLMLVVRWVRLVLWVRHVLMLGRGAFQMEVVHPLSVGRIVLRSVSRSRDSMRVLVWVRWMQWRGCPLDRRRTICGGVVTVVVMRRSGAWWILLGPGMMRGGIIGGGGS